MPDSVISIESSAFNDCTALSNVTFSVSVNNIGARAFYNCSNLRDITLPDSVITIGESAFLDCNGLTNAILGSGVADIGAYAFRYCSSLVIVTIPDSVTSMELRYSLTAPT